jgi:hypothetical protein
VSENASTHLIAEPGNAAHVIDWDNLEILPIAEDQIGAALPLMDENEMYAFVGLAAEDERAEQERQPTENEKEGVDTTAPLGRRAGNTLPNEGSKHGCKKIKRRVREQISGHYRIFYSVVW